VRRQRGLNPELPRATRSRPNLENFIFFASTCGIAGWPFRRPATSAGYFSCCFTKKIIRKIGKTECHRGKIKEEKIENFDLRLVQVAKVEKGHKMRNNQRVKKGKIDKGKKIGTCGHRSKKTQHVGNRNTDQGVTKQQSKNNCERSDLRRCGSNTHEISDTLHTHVSPVWGLNCSFRKWNGKLVCG